MNKLLVGLALTLAAVVIVSAVMSVQVTAKKPPKPGDDGGNTCKIMQGEPARVWTETAFGATCTAGKPCNGIDWLWCYNACRAAFNPYFIITTCRIK